MEKISMIKIPYQFPSISHINFIHLSMNITVVSDHTYQDQSKGSINLIYSNIPLLENDLSLTKKLPIRKLD